MEVSMNMQCIHCQKPVSSDEAAMTKKLINRGTTEFFCAKCLAEEFELEEEDIWRKADYYRSMGCTLFWPAAV